MYMYFVLCSDQQGIRLSGGTGHWHINLKKMTLFCSPMSHEHPHVWRNQCLVCNVTVNITLHALHWLQKVWAIISPKFIVLNAIHGQKSKRSACCLIFWKCLFAGRQLGLSDCVHMVVASLLVQRWNYFSITKVCPAWGSGGRDQSHLSDSCLKNA